MSHSGWSSSNYISAVAGTPPSAVPLTIHARQKHVSTGAIQTLVDVNFNSTNRFQLRVGSTDLAQAVTQATSNALAIGATTLGAGTWRSLVALFTSATDRKIYVNGSQDGSDTTSRTPTGTTKIRVGLGADGFNAAGSPIAEVAVWNVALSTDDIAALVYTSPLLIRPGALVCYIPLLDSGTLDLMAPAATVTGTLTKDNDHPRVILPRQRSLIIPKSAGGGGGGIEGVVAQTLSAFTQSSTGKLAIKANGNKTLSAFTQTSTGSGGRRGDVTQTLGAVAQSSTTGRVRIKGQV